MQHTNYFKIALSLLLLSLIFKQKNLVLGDLDFYVCHLNYLVNFCLLMLKVSN